MTPEDKLRLARTMQEQGLVVAMTGDAVNDAAALKQADIGVAMGSGSEVTKQAARMILTDDNFGTLVHAVELGRRVYDKVVAYIRFQMTQLLALVMLFVAATAFNINEGVALTPTMVLFLLFFVTVGGRRGHRRRSRGPRRDEPAPAGPEAADHQPDGGLVLAPLRRRPVPGGPRPSGRRTRRARAPTSASASMTMTFVVMGLGTVFNALANRRDPTSGITPPIVKAAAICAVPGRHDLPGDRAAPAAGGAAHRLPHRRAVGWPASPSRCCSRWSSRSASGSGAGARTAAARATERWSS